MIYGPPKKVKTLHLWAGEQTFEENQNLGSLIVVCLGHHTVLASPQNFTQFKQGGGRQRK